MRELHAGDLIGEYRLEARLGHGGFGTVWRARHAESGRLVAVKVLPENETLQDSASMRADVELLAASAASASPHIVRVLGGGIEPVPFVVMELINGTSLAEELKARGKLGQQETLDVGLGIAEALHALQVVGIVHRDVKPSNVLIDRAGTVKLTDFGIAKIAGYDAVTATGQLPLSIAYAAPEVWEGKAEHRSDLYALGVLLYQCLTGTLPFRGAYAELFYQHRSRAPDLDALPPGTARSLTEMISLCLRKDPAERPSGAAVCRAMLEKAREEISTGANLEEQKTEPAKFGPWAKGEPHASQPWAWHCSNPETGQDAVVEVHFATEAPYGEALRRAVAASERLAPYGAERLLQTNRMILRPGEAWTSPPPGQFQFWVARDEIPLPEPPGEIGAAPLLGYVTSLQDLLVEAEDAEVPLHLDADTLFLLPDGSVHLRRPGLNVAYNGEAERDAIAFLRRQHLAREVRPLVSRASNLEDLRLGLDRLMALAATGSPAQQTLAGMGWEGRPRAPVAALAAVTIVSLIAIAVWLLGGGGGDNRQAGAQPTATIAATIVPTACDTLAFPVPLKTATSACAERGPLLVFDASCPTGQACRQERDGAVTRMYVNDRSVAFADGGSLTLARENGQEATKLLNLPGATVEAIDWDPSGRYLAYLSHVPTGGRSATGGDAVSTQLWVIEATRPANNGLLLASNDIDGGGEQLILAPQWSSDGKSVFFLWQDSGDPGGDLYSVVVPYTAGGEVDFGRLRSGTPATDSYVSTALTAYDLSGTDYGPAGSYLTDLHLDSNGGIYLQVCQGALATRSCGLGVWDGDGATTLLPAEDGVVYEVPIPSPANGAFHAAKFAAGAWTLVRFDAAGPVPVEGVIFPGTTRASAPTFALSRLGDALIIETEPGVLSLIAYNGAPLGPWGAGRLPQWLVVPEAATAAPQWPPPPAVVYPTPAPTATAAPTATPQPVQAMTVLVTVRNAAGNAVSGARVIAVMNGVACATVVTGPGSSSMTVPAPNAPAACRQTGSVVSFVVNDQPAQGTLNYLPGSNVSIDLRP